MNSDINSKKEVYVRLNHWLVIIFCLLVTSVFARPGDESFPGDEKAFHSELKKTHALIEKQRWSKASKSLQKLLEKHANQEYVFAKRLDIEGYIATCAFWGEYELPKDNDLVSGDLLSYKESSGSIKLRYTPDNLGDFLSAAEENETIARTSAFIHPALFCGPYTFEVKGKSHPSINSEHVPGFIACLTDDGYYRIVTGKKGEGSGNYTRWLPPRIFHFGTEDAQKLEEEAVSPATPRKPFVLKLKVSASKVAAYYGNKEIISTKKPKKLFGRAGFEEIPFEEVIVSGKVQPSWIQGLRDLHKQKARLEFEKSYKPEDHIPEWLCKDVDIAVAKVKSQFLEIPGSYLKEQEKYIKEAESLYDDGKLEEGIKYIKKVPAKKLSKTGRAFLLALFYYANGEYDNGLEQSEIACKGDPRSYPAKFLRSRLKIATGDREQGVKELRGLIDSHPDNPEAYAVLSLQRLFKGDFAESEDILEKAQVRKLSSADLDRASKALYRAKNGPSWSNKMHEMETKHYHIITDIDKKLCREVARLLEESYTSYVVHLERIKDLDKFKFPVYLFSGQAGYMMYMKDLCMYDSGLSLGCFVPALKQLMIWNTPERDQMLRTVRHEGFHQYMDRISEDPPIWFNEGMAEYYEIAERVGGRWKLGQIHPSHKYTLREFAEDRIPLETFLHCDSAEFHKAPNMHYAQSWAFVHFLRHSTPKNKDLFEGLLETCGKMPTAEKIVEDFLGKVNLKRLQADFDKHVKDLY